MPHDIESEVLSQPSPLDLRDDSLDSLLGIVQLMVCILSLQRIIGYLSEIVIEILMIIERGFDGYQHRLWFNIWFGYVIIIFFTLILTPIVIVVLSRKKTFSIVYGIFPF